MEDFTHRVPVGEGEAEGVDTSLFRLHHDLVGDPRVGRNHHFAGLLVELHLAGCFWGDCSLSNVLYRYDANTIQAIMIDAETVELRETLSDGQRYDDLEVMIHRVSDGLFIRRRGTENKKQLRTCAVTSANENRY